jgi:hypothetical protein
MRAARVSGAALMVLAGLAGLATTPLAYTTSNATWDVTPVLYYVNPSNQDVSSSAALNAVRWAADAWSNQTNASIELVFAGQVNDTSVGYDNRNVVIFRNQDNGSTVASTHSWWYGSTRVDSDIILYDGGWDFFTGTSGCSSGAYIEDIGVHEFGHVLGLGHSDVSDASMYRRYTRCDTGQRMLHPDDVAGIESLYTPTGGGNNGPSNTAPTVTIQSPGNGTSVPQGTPVSFSGSAADYQDGNLTGQLTWTSNRDGHIGTGGSFSRVLSTGSHVVTATTSDTGGMSDSDAISMSVTVSATNTAPSVSITSPGSGASFQQGASIALSGSASDQQDGTLSSQLTWTSSRDGYLGTGTNLSRQLSAGSHTVTAAVTDSGGLQGSAVVAVTVQASDPAPAPEPPPVVSVAVTSISPGIVSLTAGRVTFVILGSGFASNAQVDFLGGEGPAPRVRSVSRDSATRLTASVDIRSGGPPRERYWDVRVTNPDGSSAVGVGLLRVVP